MFLLILDNIGRQVVHNSVSYTHTHTRARARAAHTQTHTHAAHIHTDTHAHAHTHTHRKCIFKNCLLSSLKGCRFVPADLFSLNKDLTNGFRIKNWHQVMCNFNLTGFSIITAFQIGPHCPSQLSCTILTWLDFHLSQLSKLEHIAYHNWLMKPLKRLSKSHHCPFIMQESFYSGYDWQSRVESLPPPTHQSSDPGRRSETTLR